MNSLNQFLLILISVSVIAAQVFRFDYTYHTNIKGWLKLHVIPATWEEARQRCYYEGAVLASPSSREMQSAMSTEMNKTSDCGIHTGVHSIFAKGVFQSIDGVPLERMSLKWMPGEPDDAGRNENCIAYLPDETIADVNCSEVLPYMCHKKFTEGLSISECGTTDKDYVYNKRTGNCYKFHNDKRTWSKAFEICAAEGAYLAIINSDEEARILRDLGSRSNHPIDVIYVGMHDWGEHGSWRTIHGQTLQEAGFSGWASKQPDNSPPGEYCGSIHTDAKLNDRWCESVLPFVCEKEHDSLL